MFLSHKIFSSILLTICFLLVGCQKKVVLVTDISSQEAITIQRVLAETGIQATPLTGKEGRVSVSIDPKHEVSARRVLHEYGLPRPETHSLGDMFGKEGMLTSPFEERARFLYATSQGLEDTLRNIDGVVYAKVHLVMPEKKTLVQEMTLASASVFIKYRTGSKIQILIPSIKRLVANAIPGLTSDRVAVISTPSIENKGIETQAFYQLENSLVNKTSYSTFLIPFLLGILFFSVLIVIALFIFTEKILARVENIQDKFKNFYQKIKDKAALVKKKSHQRNE